MNFSRNMMLIIPMITKVYIDVFDSDLTFLALESYENFHYLEIESSSKNKVDHLT